MKGEGAARVMERADTWIELKEAVSQHAYRTEHPWPNQHYTASIRDLRQEHPSDWPWFLSYFRGEIQC